MKKLEPIQSNLAVSPVPFRTGVKANGSLFSLKSQPTVLKTNHGMRFSAIIIALFAFVFNVQSQNVLGYRIHGKIISGYAPVEFVNVLCIPPWIPERS